MTTLRPFATRDGNTNSLLKRLDTVIRLTFLPAATKDGFIFLQEYERTLLLLVVLIGR